MSRSKNRKMADLISGGTFDDGVVAASEVTGLHSVASTGDFNELENKPTPFDPATLAGVAVSGSFNDLSDQPAPFDPTTLGTASTQATGAFATAAQGTKADAALPKAGGAMTGAITTNSTFDGRNVSVDGTKLDGIEAGATADQTAAQLLTAVKTVDGSDSGLDADLLDGLHLTSQNRNNQANSVVRTQADGSTEDFRTEAEKVEEARGIRNDILNTTLDPIVSNPLRWAELTSEQRAAWSQYRTDLLNVPQQAGFPNNITWPTEP